MGLKFQLLQLLETMILASMDFLKEEELALMKITSLSFMDSN